MAPRGSMQVKYAGEYKVKLSYEEVVAAVALAGWPEREWAKATAVIAAESDRVTNIFNTYLEGHWGLMQIGKKQHPAFFKKAQWWSPADNAKYGYQLRRSQGWGAWEAYTNGRYSGYMLQASAAAKSVVLKRNANKISQHPLSNEKFYESLFSEKLKNGLTMLMVSNVANSVEGGTEAIGDTIEASGEAVLAAAQQIQSNSIFGGITTLIGAAKWISNPDNWLRVGQVILGGGMVLAGVAIVARPGVQKAAAAAAPVTKTIKKVAA